MDGVGQREMGSARNTAVKGGGGNVDYCPVGGWEGRGGEGGSARGRRQSSKANVVGIPPTTTYWLDR